MAASAFQSRALANDCAWLDAVIADINKQQERIDDWVRNEGSLHVAQLETTIARLEKVISSNSAVVNKAQRKEAVALMGTLISGTILVLGVTGAIAATPLFVAGIFVSSGMIMIQATVTPNEIDAIETVALRKISDAERVLEAYPKGNIGVATRSATATAAKLSSACLAVYDFINFVKAANKSAEAEQTLARLHGELAGLKQDLQALKQTGNLRAFRQDQLNKLADHLGAIKSKNCAGTVVLP